MDRILTSEETYKLILSEIADSKGCVRWKDIDATLGDRIENSILAKHIDIALECGDLVRISIGCICAPEYVELCRERNETENDYFYLDDDDICF